ncbi:acetylornithine deacetylase [Xinfangfangia sp. CPCC 101601]|uniref:Acetylornithine deacetylase n=1 Tax=Pseudogemmobacter lacusdianii TaxID=3069608 RepID=A0ABU0W0R0_9RHOB|nr:acetylornithine deacetylase [Xinfangfangia sp. CPCC 101601]MDQ2067000.1 acetylornithine deacetylase [Xinfangfangia sp. CPCC 101601]
MEILTPRQILDVLVGFPTLSRVSNLALIDWLEAYLAGHGVQCFRHWNEDRQKAALMAHAGPWQEGGIVLSGHSDVVPVDGQNWASDPWQVSERDGRLYGRGTCDMKGFVALAAWALVEAQRRGIARPLQLALSYDEEIGCLGAPAMLQTMRRVLPKAQLAIIGEPSRMQVITGHKSGTGFDVHVKGYEIHSALMPQGVSAVMEAARLIAWVNAQNDRLAVTPPTPLAARFDPPFTTLHIGQIAGGTAENITAADCHFSVEMRVIPGEDPSAWEAAFAAEAQLLHAALVARRPEAGVYLTRFTAVPPLVPEPSSAHSAEALACQLTGHNSSGVVSYLTEAGQFQAEGYSAVVCGPGDIAQAHQPDEYIELAQFEAGYHFMQRLLDHLQ